MSSEHERFISDEDAEFKRIREKKLGVLSGDEGERKR